jgi:hypothetical protein
MFQSKNSIIRPTSQKLFKNKVPYNAVVFVVWNPRISWPLKMGPIGCPEMSARNYQHTLRNIPEDGRPHLLRGGSMKTVSTSKRARVFGGIIVVKIIRNKWIYRVAKFWSFWMLQQAVHGVTIGLCTVNHVCHASLKALFWLPWLQARRNLTVQW